MASTTVCKRADSAENRRRRTRSACDFCGSMGVSHSGSWFFAMVISLELIGQGDVKIPAVLRNLGTGCKRVPLIGEVRVVELVQQVVDTGVQ